MQDAVDVTGAGYEFTWFYTLETGYSVLVQWRDTTQVSDIISSIASC